VSVCVIPLCTRFSFCVGVRQFTLSHATSARHSGATWFPSWAPTTLGPNSPGTRSCSPGPAPLFFLAGLPPGHFMPRHHSDSDAPGPSTHVRPLGHAHPSFRVIVLLNRARHARITLDLKLDLIEMHSHHFLAECLVINLHLFSHKVCAAHAVEGPWCRVGPAAA
jgi:hypothetical protein